MKNFKQKLSEWLEKNDVGKAEFYVYCVMAALAVIWTVMWIVS